MITIEFGIRYTRGVYLLYETKVRNEGIPHNLTRGSTSINVAFLLLEQLIYDPNLCERKGQVS